MEDKTGGPAFPKLESLSKDRFDDYTAQISDGMTLLDYFAAKVLQGAAASPDAAGMPWSQIASSAYNAAEAMLKERERRMMANY